jgi:membrane protein DedA with SNARE-associated domain
MSEILELIRQFWFQLQSGQVLQVGLWIYPLITLLVAIEGPIAILLAASAASTGLLNPFFAFLAASAGNLTADTVWYSLGYLGKIDWLMKIGKRFGVNQPIIEHLSHEIRRNAVKILFFAKLTNGFIIPALIVAGMVRVPWRRWFPFIAVAETLITGTLITIIYYAAASIQKVGQGLEYVLLAGTVLFLLAGFYIVRRTLISGSFARRYITQPQVLPTHEQQNRPGE